MFLADALSERVYKGGGGSVAAVSQNGIGPVSQACAVKSGNDRLSTQSNIDMLSTCSHAWRMSSMIQIRNVPAALHRRLKARAAMAGKSLSDYLLGEIRETAERPTLEELRARLASRSAASPPVGPAEAVRAERDSR